MTDITPPFVTVLIPAYNAAATIRRAIDSVFAQHYPSFEIVVVDDGSRDPTSDMVASYQRKEIRLLRLGRNHGEGGVLNEGIAIAKGEYIAFLDADDEWLPTKLVKQIELIESSPNATMVTCGCLFADASGNIVERFGMPPPGFEKSEIWRSLLAEACIAKPCVVARAVALARVGSFDTTIPIAADQDMWIRLAIAGDVEFVREYLTVAHDTSGSLTKTHVQEIDRATFPMLRRHLERCRHDLSREEIRRILLVRYAMVGRNLYTHGRSFRGLCLLLRSLSLGARLGETLWYLAVASPPARAAKRMMQRGPAAFVPPLPEHCGPTLLAPADRDLVALPEGPPILIATVDFGWSSRSPRLDLAVQNMRNQLLAQEIFDRFEVRPTYFVDYAAATQPEGYDRLAQIAGSGRCEIGAHMRPWETPPVEEELGGRTSCGHNLPAWLQKEKLSRLTDMIVANFGIRPLSYRGGRYGVGEEIAWILEALGYLIDMSVLPGIDMRRRHGPDFRQVPDGPYWFGRDRTLIEIPATAAFLGLLASPGLPKALSGQLYDLLSRPRFLKAHSLGLFSRLGLLERHSLTPGRTSFAELRRLTLRLLSRGGRVFVLTCRGSSLLPGSTQKLRSRDDLSHFLATIETYLRFFFGEVGGVTMTPMEFRTTLLGVDGATPVAHPVLSAAR
jgi:glycosyltransferase involved in cell wall biosynthesis